LETETTIAGTIYALHNGDDKIRYVGQTYQPAEDRFNRHKWDSTQESGSAVSRWIAKHGADNIVMIVLEELDDVNLLDEREIFYIDHYQTYVHAGNNGLNMTIGGGGMRGYKHSEETLSKIVASNTGKTRSDEFKEQQRMRALGNTHNVGRKHDPESIEKRVAKMKGRPQTPEAKANIAAAAKVREERMKANGTERKMPPKGIGNHKRWHVDGKTSSACNYCQPQ
jgi:group I intron endonuclease